MFYSLQILLCAYSIQPRAGTVGTGRHPWHAHMKAVLKKLLLSLCQRLGLCCRAKLLH